MATMKVTPIEKMNKKAQREYYSRQRGSNGFNTGTRDMGKIKRDKFAEMLDKEMEKYYN